MPLSGTGYKTKPLLSVGDTVPLTGDPARDYQMVGIPDGTGAHRNSDGTRTILMNHELPVSPTVATSQPIIGDPLNRGAIVSKLIVDRRGNVLSADRAYDFVYDESQPSPVSQPARTRPTRRDRSRASARRRSSGRRMVSTAGSTCRTRKRGPRPTRSTRRAASLSRSSTTSSTRCRRWAASRGRTPFPSRTSGSRTVVMGMEDGPFVVDPAVENSQVYMYVGRKQRGPGVSVLNRNGLDNGLLFVLAPVDPAQRLEPSFGDESGSIPVKWVLVPNADSTTEAQLEAASDAAGAMNFARPEDGAFNKRNKNQYFFVTTGGLAGGNELGRLYSLNIDRKDPTAQGTLRVVYEADEVIAAGGDTAISPDNIDTSEKYLMINEDGTTESRLVMGEKGRDGSIWRFKITGGSSESRRVPQSGSPSSTRPARPVVVWSVPASGRRAASPTRQISSVGGAPSSTSRRIHRRSHRGSNLGGRPVAPPHAEHADLAPPDATPAARGRPGAGPARRHGPRVPVELDVSS